MPIRILLLIATIYCACPLTESIQAQVPELKFGMSTALSGPAADLGIQMRRGVLAGFKRYNEATPANPFKLNLIALDDGYEPEQSAPNMRQLIDDERVLGIIGNVGTPTAVAAIPISNASHTLFFAAFTGAGALRKTPPDPFVINYRASYGQEVGAMVDALIDVARLKPEEIAFFTQRDAYGDAGYSGGIAALQRHGLKDLTKIAHVRYDRNTLAVESALAEIVVFWPSPKAVIAIGAYAPVAKFIKIAKDNSFNPLFLNVSFVGSQALADHLGADGNGVIVTQVVPPYEEDYPIAKEYLKDLEKLDPQARPSFGSFEGYVASRILSLALRSTSTAPDRQQLVRAIEDLGDFDIGLKQPMSLSKEDHQASDKIWPTVLRDGHYRSFQWGEIAHFLKKTK